MKVYIAYDIVEKPTGGANQFLRILREGLIDADLFTESPITSDIILFNGHHNLQKVAELKRSFPSKIFIHRMDGLQKLYNKPDDIRQDIAFEANRKLADVTVFQSQWALDKHAEFGLSPDRCKIIMNCVDEKIFNRDLVTKRNFKKTKLITTSWSPNINKGFDCYKYFDEELDFSKYTFLIIGNSPYKFKNIGIAGPFHAASVAQLLKRADIYVTASKNDCCSNSLIEALSCGLPSVARNSGGNPEIVGHGGILFEEDEDAIEAINKVSSSIESFSDKILVPTSNEIIDQYIDLFEAAACTK